MEVCCVRAGVAALLVGQRAAQAEKSLCAGKEDTIGQALALSWEMVEQTTTTTDSVDGPCNSA